jgi:hypothetical protein
MVLQRRGVGTRDVKEADLPRRPPDDVTGVRHLPRVAGDGSRAGIGKSTLLRRFADDATAWVATS